MGDTEYIVCAHQDGEELIDPDPFGIGIAIFAAMASGASFLETRRGNNQMQQAQRSQFRTSWFDARRSVIFFKRSVDEFETYILEDGYGRRNFQIGAVRLTVGSHRLRQLRRLRGQALTTAQTLGDNLDDLSNFLGVEDQPRVTAILDGLTQLAGLPERYTDLIRNGRTVVDLYTDLLDEIADREGFEEDTSNYSTGD